MKKNMALALGLVLSTSAFTAFAQENKFSVGVEFGPNVTSIRGNEYADRFYESAVRYYGGLSFQYNINTTVSVRTGLAYERKGDLSKPIMTDEYGLTIGEGDVRLIYSYLTVPLLVRATFGDKLKYFVNAGPYMGYGFKFISEEEYPGFPDRKVDYTSGFKKTDFGLSFGAGINYPVNEKFDVSLETRNNLGLSEINDFEIVDGSIKTNTFNILIGAAYKF